MKLYELINVLLSDFIVGVSQNGTFIEEFDSADTGKRTKYREAVVTGVHVLNEDTIAVNVEI